MSTNGVAKDKHTAALLSTADEETYVLLRNLLAPRSAKEKSFAEIVQMLQAHFEPRMLVIVEIFWFHRQNQ